LTSGIHAGNNAHGEVVIQPKAERSDETDGDARTISEQKLHEEKRKKRAVAALVAKYPAGFSCTNIIVPNINGMSSRATYHGATLRMRHPPPVNSAE